MPKPFATLAAAQAAQKLSRCVYPRADTVSCRPGSSEIDAVLNLKLGEVSCRPGSSEIAYKRRAEYPLVSCRPGSSEI